MTRIIAALIALLVLPESAQAAFPGGNGEIAFTRNPSFIYTIGSAGTGPATPLMDPLAGKDSYHPAWAADGRRIAFTSTRDSTGPVRADQEIYAMYADGSGLTRVTNDPAVDNVGPRGRPTARGSHSTPWPASAATPTSS